MDGVLNINKPAGVSSAWVVTQVKKLLGRTVKVGHAGTLDPFATGVLLILIGRGTKMCESLMSQPKQYVAAIKLGATTETLDPTSPEIITPVAASPPLETIQAILPRFIGQIEQRPPAYSALKIAGKPAYKLARKGKEVDLKARPVHVYSIDLLEYHWPVLRLKIDCGRGTYIRSIARDIGEALGTGGYLAELSRTRVGQFTIADALTLDQVRQQGVERSIQPIG